MKIIRRIATPLHYLPNKRQASQTAILIPESVMPYSHFIIHNTKGEGELYSQSQGIPLHFTMMLMLVVSYAVEELEALSLSPFTQE
jgi:hypothetical protein